MIKTYLKQLTIPALNNRGPILSWVCCSKKESHLLGASMTIFFGYDYVDYELLDTKSVYE